MSDTPYRLIPAGKVDPRQVIEASRVLAGQSRDQYAPALWKALSVMPVPISVRDQEFIHSMKQRMDLVMDCFNTGAAMMLKLLHGDSEPEPWSEDYDHEARIRALLDKYGCLAVASTESSKQSQGAPSSEPASTTGTQTKGE